MSIVSSVVLASSLGVNVGIYTPPLEISYHHYHRVPVSKSYVHYYKAYPKYKVIRKKWKGRKAWKKRHYRKSRKLYRSGRY